VFPVSLRRQIVLLQASRCFRGPVIPLNTVRAIEGHTGLVDSVWYRASPETELRAALASLSPGER
jgi:hypothetical protein